MVRKVFLVLGLALCSGSAWAIPQTLNFQGFLKESGSPVGSTATVTREIRFKIYNDLSGGTALFSEDHNGGNAVSVSSGVFNAIIGDLTSGGIPLSYFDGRDKYVGVTVGAGSELIPRQKITSVANAFFAATAANLSTSTVIQISSAVFTATGSSQYSLQTSSGINVQAGGVTAPFFAGSFVGDGSGLSGITGTDGTKVAKTGDTMTGQLTLSGSTLTVTGSGFSVGGATLAVASGKIGIGTASPATKLHLSSGALTIDGSGAGLNVAGPSSATYFYGNGAGLTGVIAPDDTKVAKSGDNMSGQLTLAGSTLTVTGNAFSIGGSTLAALAGKIGVGTASPATKLHLSSGALTIDGSGAGISVVGASSATYFYGDGSGLTGVTDSTKIARTGDTMTGQLTLLGSTLTVTGDAFSVGGATMVVAGGRIGLGTAFPATKLHLSSGALTIDGSGAGMIVAGASSATYFYGNGSGLTGITGTTQNSSYVYLTGEYTNSGATMGGETSCIFGSSVTLTTSGNPVEISFSFSQAHTTTAGGTRVQVLMDSDQSAGWIDDFGASESMAPMGRESGGAAVQLFPTELHYRTVTAPSAGQHKFCVTFERTANGTSYIVCKKGGSFTEGPKKCLFMVKELK